LAFALPGALFNRRVRKRRPNSSHTSLMTPRTFRHSCLILASFLLIPSAAFSAEPAALSAVKTQADLDALIASTGDSALKQAMRDNAAAILAAAELRPHVEAVIHTIETSPGKVEKINTTPETLKKAAGGDIALFDTLKLVDLSMPNAGPHDARKSDPYDAAFFDHLGHIPSLESIYIIATKASDDWIAPLGKLTHLKSLRFVNNGKLTDAGLEHLAGLRQLESFAFVGTAMQGHAFAKFDGWTNLKSCSFRGSSIDDEGLRLLCERFLNLESLSLAHARFTDAGAVNFPKLAKLKSLEIGTHNATPQTLPSIAKLPLESLQLGEGFDSPECIPLIKSYPHLHRLTITNAKAYKAADVKLIATMSQLESLEFSDLELTDDTLSQFQSLTFLKALRLVHRPQPYPAETQAKIKSILPKVALKFD
jgi:Leucine Rich repeat